jgi:protein phosphatase
LETEEFHRQVAEFLNQRVGHYVLDGGKLVVVHAGLEEAMHGRESREVDRFCSYGETNGETDGWGMPVRLDWASDYRGAAKVVHGHTPVRESTWRNGTLDIDTGCVFGGKLTSLRYPENELVSVPSRAIYAAPERPPVTHQSVDASE